MTAPLPENQNPSYLHSLKLEETAKGLRISVHVYSSNQEQAIEEALKHTPKSQDDRNG
jgi:hypothetical protein